MAGPQQLTRRHSPPRSAQPRWAAGLVLLALLGVGCDSKDPAPASARAAQPPPDRLTQQERLPESEVAFGLSLPPGLRVTRQFNDSAYFLGRVDFTSALLHIKERVSSGSVEMMGTRAVFARTQIKGDEAERWFQIEVSRERNGTQVYIRDITPPPTPKGATEAEMWTRAGRNPDGTPRDENQQY